MNTTLSLSILCILLVSTSISVPGLPLYTFKKETIDSSFASAHLITNVPYVCQETDFYCAYACPTMIFQYYQINTSLTEVVYNSGVGYALLYSPPYAPRSPIGCIATCKWGNDRCFLATLYGLSYDEWRVNLSNSESQRWDTYWMKVKENISQNKPVITNVDPMNLPSLRNAIRKEIGITPGLWTKITDLFWDLSPSYMYHAIVLVGYNEENQTVCYHDPAAGLYGCPEVGTYSWMDLNIFRRALKRLYIDSPFFSYMVETFTDTIEVPLDKKQAFLLAHERNIEKLKGNTSVYDPLLYEQWTDTLLGIPGIQQMHTDIAGSITNRIKTIGSYKYLTSLHFQTAEYRLNNLLQYILPATSNFSTCPDFVNKFKQIALEKQTITTYLQTMQSTWNDSTITQICQKDAELLSSEYTNWSKLADSYAVFLKKGLLLSTPRAVLVLKHMTPYIENILVLEQELSRPVVI